jgi:uncharacterized membrane protein
MIQKIKSQIFILAIASLLLFAAVCYILLGVFWKPLYHFWAALPSYIRLQNLFYYLWFVFLVVIDTVAAGLSFLLFKNKPQRVYFCIFILAIILATFLSFLFMHLHSLCYI